MLILRSDSKQGERIRAKAKQDDTWVNCTFGRALQTVLVLDDGHVVGSAFSPRTMLNRLKNATDLDPTMMDRADEMSIDKGGYGDEQD